MSMKEAFRLLVHTWFLCSLSKHQHTPRHTEYQASWWFICARDRAEDGDQASVVLGSRSDFFEKQNADQLVVGPFVPGAAVPSRRQAASGRWTSARGGTGFPSVGVSRLSLSFCTGVPGSPSVLWRRAFKRRACPGQAIPARLQYSRHCPDTSATSDARGRGCITYTAEISSQAAPEPPGATQVR